MEILPPAVQTELHDAKHQPDMKDGGRIGMPLDEFAEECWNGLREGRDAVPVGRAKEMWEWEEERGRRFGEIAKMMKGGK